VADRIEVQWCTRCGARFTSYEVAGATCCPQCGCSGVPCSTKQDMVIEVNWHELRVLGIWASNFAQKLGAEGCRGAAGKVLGGCGAVSGAAGRLPR